MSIDDKYLEFFSNVTSKAAVSVYDFIGKKNKIAADKAAVDTMRNELNQIDMNGKVVIGEGELDQAPMLYIGETLGSKKGPEFDIAVDPVEGTNFVANNMPGALSVISVAEKNNLFNAPETYMDKIAINKNEKNIVDLDFGIKKNIGNLADSLNKDVSEISACILNRPRHKHIISELKDLKVRIKLINDGDVSGALLVSDKKYKIDIFLGIGGGPEGVLAASALDSFGCFFQGRFLFDTNETINRAKAMGIQDLKKKYELNEIVTGDSIFCATGITSGDLVDGISKKGDKFITHTLVTHKSRKLNKILLKEDIIKT
tara:strand:- start:58 stop:1005 length:948 start_codon:yes stop_codon:yes gene_type:complete